MKLLDFVRMLTLVFDISSFLLLLEESKGIAVSDLACLHSPNILLAGHSTEDIQVPSVI